MIDPEQYFQNTDDIINEEDYEESVCESRQQSPERPSKSLKTFGAVVADVVKESTPAQVVENKSVTAEAQRPK